MESTSQRLARLTRAYRLAEGQHGRLIRERAGLSLREMAGALGVSPADLSRWERHLVRPRPRAALQWLKACDAIRFELQPRANLGPHAATPPTRTADGATDTKPATTSVDPSLPPGDPDREPSGGAAT
jgi:transcriptional regulator with XRE-family HTH domain